MTLLEVAGAFCFLGFGFGFSLAVVLCQYISRSSR